MEAIVDASQVAGGELIGGRYRLEEKIGEGGMASVWRAVDTTLDRPVAVKFLYARDPRQREQLGTAFMREAKIAAAVRHRYVVSILDFGTFGEATPYMVMELLEGETLRRLLEREGPLSPQIVIDLAAHVLEGLAAVHEAGIVHRDLKPENVFIQHERARTLPKLLDFGISRSVGGEGGRRSALTTQDGKLVGTPEYMSPEQASGEGKVDLRTDLYSLGVIMYEALTGRQPFAAEGMGTLIVRIIMGQCPSVRELRPELPRALSDFVARAMAQDREARFADAVEMHVALLAVAERCFGSQLAQALSIPPRAGAVTGTATTVSGVVARHPRAPAVTELPAVEHEPARARSTGSGRGPWLLGLSAIVASAGAVLGFLYFIRQPAPAAERQHFIVMRDARSASEPPRDEPPPSEPPANAEPGAAREPVDPRAEAPAGGAQSDRPKPDPQPTTRRRAPEASLASTFARHKPQIAKCFDPDVEAPAFSLHLALDRAGRVQTAEVSPPAAADTAPARCVVRVARAIEFGPQPKELSLRVPISVHTER